MKTTFKLLTLILVVAITTAQTALGAEKTKKYHQAWPANGVQSLKINNKFGEVKFVNDGGSDVTIDVVVTVEASSESKADAILAKVDVKMGKTGDVVTAETNLANNINARRFSIDYVVNVPSDKNLKVTNKYGNVVVNRLTGLGDFDVQYGNITAVSLKGTTTKLSLEYGKGNIDETGSFDLNIRYSNISLGTIGNFNLNSAYSVIDADKALETKAVSRYDKLAFGEQVSFSADSKYSQIKIDRLTKKLYIGSGYGGIKVGSIAPDFESVSIVNSYGQISLGLINASYTIDASCSYCGISYPEDRFKGNRIKEDTSIELNGKIGNAGGGTVKIESQYGEIKLNE